jgi:hypothetical protein
MKGTARCPVCGAQLPVRDQQRGGRKPRYCPGACKAKAYRATYKTIAGTTAVRAAITEVNDQ